MRVRSFLVRILSLASVSVVIAACSIELGFGPEFVEGSGQVETQVFDLDPFRNVEIGSQFTAVITYEPNGIELVEVTADDNFFALLQVEVNEETLVVRSEPDVSFKDFAELGIRIRTQTLETVEVSGASRVEVDANNGPDLDYLRVSGASVVSVVDAAASSIDVRVSGASTVSVVGIADLLDLDVSGASEVDLSELEVERASVSLSGASAASIAPAETVSGRVGGASELILPEGVGDDVELGGASTLTNR